MTNDQDNRLKMLRSVRNVVTQREEAAKKIAKFMASYIVLKGKIAEIEAFAKLQETGQTGLAAGKNRIKKELADIAAKYTYKLIILARETANDKMLGEINFSKSELTGASEEALLNRVNLIHERIESNLSLLEDQGLNADTQKLFLEKIRVYNEAITTPRSGVAERKNATEKLVRLFEEADSALQIMDLAVKSAQDEQPDFYSQYRTARRLVDTGLRKISLKGIAIDLTTKKLIRGVMFTFRHNGDSQTIDGNGEIVKKTAKAGRFVISSLIAGSYQVNISKPGYEEKNTEIIVNDGEKSELKVELVKV